MHFEKKRIYEIVKSSKFDIPSFQRPYRWGEENCKKLFEKIVEAAESDIRYYVGNVFYENLEDGTSKRIFDGQQRTFSVFLLDLAFVCYGNLKDCEELVTRFANYKLSQKDLKEKFVIHSSDQDKYQEFITKYCDLLLEKEKFQPHNFFKDLESNIFVRNFLAFYELLFNTCEKGFDNEDFSNLCQLDILSKLYEAFKNLHIVEVSRSENDRSLAANKVFDCLNATGKPLTINDIVRSKVFLHCRDLMEEMDSFTNRFDSQSDPNKSKPELSDVEKFYVSYLKCLGHNSQNVYHNFDKEIEFLEKVKKLDKQKAYSYLLNNMKLVHSFMKIPQLEHSKLEVIKRCFLKNDLPTITVEQLKWIKTYLDGISLFSSAKFEVSLFLKYLEGVISYKEFLKCLHYYWSVLMKNNLVGLYKTPFKNKNIPKSILSLRSNNTVDNNFVDSFVEECKNAVNEVLIGDSKNLFDVINYLVTECDHEDQKNSDSILKASIYNKESSRMVYFPYLMLFAKNNDEFGLKYQCARFYDRDNYYSESLTSKKNVLNGDDLGNLVLVPKEVDVSQAQETVRFATLLQKAISRVVQKLPNSSWDISETSLKERNKQMLIELLQIVDFDSNSHLYK